jgi:hypothetical protein
VEVREQYQVEISNGTSAVEDKDDNMDLDEDCESMRDVTKISAKGSLCYVYVIAV